MFWTDAGLATHRCHRRRTVAMGNLWSQQSSWTDIVFVVHCARQTFYEHIFDADSIRDWDPEVRDVCNVQDGVVAPGLLFKTAYANATAYIEFLAKAVDEDGVGAHVQWRFYWAKDGPPIRPPAASETATATEPAHAWLKVNYDFAYTTDFFLIDSPTQTDVTKIIRQTTSFHHRRSLWFPEWAAHANVQMTPDQKLMKEAAERKWKDQPLPSEQARKAGKTWPHLQPAAAAG